MLTGDGTTLDAQELISTPEGRQWFARERPLAMADDVPPKGFPTPDETWTALFRVAPEFSEFQHEAERAQGDLLGRGVYNSGISVRTAQRLAARHGYRWHQDRKEFERPWLDRVRVPGVIGVGVVATVLAGIGAMASERAALAVTAAATAAAAFAAPSCSTSSGCPVLGAWSRTLRHRQRRGGSATTSTACWLGASPVGNA